MITWRLRSGKKGKKSVVEKRVKVVPLVNQTFNIAENNILDFEK